MGCGIAKGYSGRTLLCGRGRQSVDRDVINSMPIYLKVVVQKEKARRFYEKQGLICTQRRTERTMTDFSVEEVVYQYL